MYKYIHTHTYIKRVYICIYMIIYLIIQYKQRVRFIYFSLLFCFLLLQSPDNKFANEFIECESALQ